MNPEQVRAAYGEGFNSVYDQRVNNWEEAQMAGLVEVARQQAEHDVKILESLPATHHGFLDGHQAISQMRTQFTTATRVKPGGNPRTPEEAQHEYYLVPASMNLRYAPQYAEVALNDLDDALNAQAALKRRGVKYTIYNRSGEMVWTTSAKKRARDCN